MSLNRKSVLDMTAKEARDFFLKTESYVSLLLPEYFDFQPVIDFAVKELENNDFPSIIKKNKLVANDNVNHTILMNKDASYDWRPVEIIHPFLYVNLVNKITNEKNWSEIICKFKDFQSNKKIECISIPVESISEKTDTAETILDWWEEMEQKSIEKSMEYDYCIRTDVTNCFGSIYTHTIDWAINGKQNAKNNRNGNSFGNILDRTIRELQCGQTNGIPQGGVLFNFIAEIVLGYSDSQLSKEIRESNIVDYSVVRYRDDYRIFANTKDDAERIVKILSDVLSDLNMHFNSKKTGITQDIITNAIKPDKIYWNSKIPILISEIWDGNTKKTRYSMTLQKHLLEIFWLSKKFPNSGSINKALTSFAKRLDGQEFVEENVLPLISIVADIVSNNPKSIPAGVGVLSKLLEKSDTEKALISKIVKQITTKLKNTPNLKFLEIWLQRLSISVDESLTFEEKLCNAASDSDYAIWDSSFFKSEVVLPSIINTKKIDSVKSEIDTDVFDIFSEYN